MKAINELLSIMKTLRDPNKGCPWDKAQTIDSIAPYTLEEAYEILESIENRQCQKAKPEPQQTLFAPKPRLSKGQLVVLLPTSFLG